jgi:transposase
MPLSAPCPCCGDRMTLRLIEPHIPGHDQRTFQCQNCGFEEKTIVRLR